MPFNLCFLNAGKGDKLINTIIVSNLAYNTSEDMFIKELKKTKEINEDVPNLIKLYIDYYNNERPSYALNYKTPIQYKTESGF